MDKGGDGVEKKEKGRICYYGCAQGSELGGGLYLCSVLLKKCERDGDESLSYTKKGSLMG